MYSLRDGSNGALRFGCAVYPNTLCQPWWLVEPVARKRSLRSRKRARQGGVMIGPVRDLPLGVGGERPKLKREFRRHPNIHPNGLGVLKANLLDRFVKVPRVLMGSEVV